MPKTLILRSFDPKPTGPINLLFDRFNDDGALMGPHRCVVAPDDDVQQVLEAVAAAGEIGQTDVNTVLAACSQHFTEAVVSAWQALKAASPPPGLL
ncbi:MAG: hypothetical protein FJX46_00230 [Alphaproteobacteria bacterium]|nr:hypothetical protein [Alphaproteobacteria bacterium]